jgi:folate-binding protein YgfZ
MPQVDMTEWRRVLVTGSDALEWLDDLVSAGLSGAVGPRRSLLLTPTGRIRADFHVMPRFAGGILLIQDPVQPKPIQDVLAPYVLSSDVVLAPAQEPITSEWIGDALNPDGGGEAIPLEAFDEWRTHEGIPRLGVDLDEDSLPQEAGWERFIDFTKGCFMGQEAMAKIRNLGGHPNRVIRALRADAPVVAAERLFANDQEVGVITSAAETDVIARVKWDARDDRLVTESGTSLRDR